MERQIRKFYMDIVTKDYLKALDRGDMEVIGEILAAAMSDRELDEIIREIDVAYQEHEENTLW